MGDALRSLPSPGVRWRRLLPVGAVLATIAVGMVAGVADAQTAPGVPSGLQAVGGYEQLVLSWYPPVADGGSAITGYQIDWTSTASVGMVSGISQTANAWTTHTLTGLTHGVVYSITVAAINSQGTGTPTSPIQGTPYTLPGPPADLSGQLVDGYVTLSWLPPGVIGGATVTGYQIEGKPTESDVWAVTVLNTGSVATTHTFFLLPDGGTYDFRASAINAAGVGPASGSWLITTPTTTTVVPTTTTVVPTTTVSPTSTAAPAATTLPPATTTGTTVAPATTTVTPATTVAPSTSTTVAPPPMTTLSPARGMVPPRPVYIG